MGWGKMFTVAMGWEKMLTVAMGWEKLFTVAVRWEKMFTVAMGWGSLFTEPMEWEKVFKDVLKIISRLHFNMLWRIVKRIVQMSLGGFHNTETTQMQMQMSYYSWRDVNGTLESITIMDIPSEVNRHRVHCSNSATGEMVRQ